MKTLALVPARAGSKGVPGKNKRPFAGKPLVSWAIEVAKATCGGVCVSSDDPDILRIAEGYEVQALARPQELASDETPMLDVCIHALACQTEPPDVLVLLQPTQPLRTAEHVKAGVTLMDGFCDSVVSVVQIPPHMAPEWALRIRSDGWLSVPSGPNRRQDIWPTYYRDGTVYVLDPELLLEGKLYGHAIRPLVISESESCSIDTEADWLRAEQMWRTQHGVV